VSANTDTAGEPYLQFTGVNGNWNDLSTTSTTPNRYVRETLLAASPLTVDAGAGAVTFSGAIGQKKALGNTAVTGGAITFGAATSVGANTLTVTASTSTTATASALTAASLVLQGAGAHTFTNAANNITTLAAGTVAQPVGGLSYFDADTLSVGTVGSVVGIRANGAVQVASGGILTLAAGCLGRDRRRRGGLQVGRRHPAERVADDADERRRPGLLVEHRRGDHGQSRHPDFG